MHIKIGTRGSKLALWQAYHVQDLLASLHIDSDVVIIETKGDKILDVTLSKIGSKGIFTQELEDQLRTGKIDIAVHSAKDLQSHLDDDLEIIAFGKRENPQDVLVSYKSGLDISDTYKQHIIGTSSTRRVALLRHYYPHLGIVDMRGNLQTRFEKMRRGNCDAMILAYAGVHRMGYDTDIQHFFSLDEFVPPVGQGAIAIQCTKQLDPEKRNIIRSAINHLEDEICLRAERAFLAGINGGCSVPAFAHCMQEGSKILITAGIVSLDGKDMVKLLKYTTPADAIGDGALLAGEVLNKGGDVILQEIKKSLNH